MGARGPLPKPESKRQRRNRKPQIHTAPIEKPAPPAGLLKSSRELWNRVWSGETRKSWREDHIPAVTRWIKRIDERERAERVIRKEGRLARGSQGQPVQHPLLKYIDSCDAEIRQLEDRLGLSPRGLQQIGMPAQGMPSLEELNRALEHDDDQDEADPRLQVVR